jgi:hypothetical protein
MQGHCAGIAESMRSGFGHSFSGIISDAEAGTGVATGVDPFGHSFGRPSKAFAHHS